MQEPGRRCPDEPDPASRDELNRSTTGSSMHPGIWHCSVATTLAAATQWNELRCAVRLSSQTDLGVAFNTASSPGSSKAATTMTVAYKQERRIASHASSHKVGPRSPPASSVASADERTWTWARTISRRINNAEYADLVTGNERYRQGSSNSNVAQGPRLREEYPQ